MSLPLFIIPGVVVGNGNKLNSEEEGRECIDSSSRELVEYLMNLRAWGEKSEEVSWQIHLVEEALAGNCLRDLLTPKWGR